MTTACHDIYEAPARVAPVPGQIVVGVDGSDESVAALRWAAGQASLSGARLTVVTVYRPVSEVVFAAGGYPAVDAVSPAAVERDAADLLASVAARAGVGGDVELRSLAEVSPSKALLRLGRSASMLVVGAKQRTGLGLLLGSTAASCVRHATCPVVVVPAGEAA